MTGAYADVLNLCATEAICAANGVGQMAGLLEKHILECAACTALISVIKPVDVEVAKSIPELKEVA
jgi:hypothetical protein